MKVITCDHPHCKSYYQSHPTANNDLTLALRSRGWQVIEVESSATSIHFCQAHRVDDPGTFPNAKGPVEVDVEDDQ